MPKNFITLTLDPNVLEKSFLTPLRELVEHIIKKNHLTILDTHYQGWLHLQKRYKNPQGIDFKYRDADGLRVVDVLNLVAIDNDLARKNFSSDKKVILSALLFLEIIIYFDRILVQLDKHYKYSKEESALKWHDSIAIFLDQIVFCFLLVLKANDIDVDDNELVKKIIEAIVLSANPFSSSLYNQYGIKCLSLMLNDIEGLLNQSNIPQTSVLLKPLRLLFEKIEDLAVQEAIFCKLIQQSHYLNKAKISLIKIDIKGAKNILWQQPNLKSRLGFFVSVALKAYNPGYAASIDQWMIFLTKNDILPQTLDIYQSVKGKVDFFFKLKPIFIFTDEDNMVFQFWYVRQLIHINSSNAESLLQQWFKQFLQLLHVRRNPRNRVISGIKDPQITWLLVKLNEGLNDWLQYCIKHCFVKVQTQHSDVESDVFKHAFNQALIQKKQHAKEFFRTYWVPALNLEQCDQSLDHLWDAIVSRESRTHADQSANTATTTVSAITMDNYGGDDLDDDISEDPIAKYEITDDRVIGDDISDVVMIDDDEVGGVVTRDCVGDNVVDDDVTLGDMIEHVSVASPATSNSSTSSPRPLDSYDDISIPDQPSYTHPGVYFVGSALCLVLATPCFVVAGLALLSNPLTMSLWVIGGLLTALGCALLGVASSSAAHDSKVMQSYTNTLESAVVGSAEKCSRLPTQSSQVGDLNCMQYAQSTRTKPTEPKTIHRRTRSVT